MATIETSQNFSVRPGIKERIRGGNQIQTLMCGGTIFSQVIDGVRVGGTNIPDPNAYLAEKFPQYKNRLNPQKIDIYSGLSEDIDQKIMEDIEIKAVHAINDHPEANNFVMFVGSDMTEVIARKLYAGMAGELEELGIKLFLVWANNPVPDSQALSQIETALKATENSTLNGGVYVVSKQKLIKAENVCKATWDNEPMYYFDITDEEEMRKEIERREKNRTLAEKLSIRLFHKPLDQLIEEMDPGRYEHAWRNIVALRMFHPKATVDLLGIKRKTRKSVKEQWLNYHLSTDPVDHPHDSSKAVAIKHINLSTNLQSPEELYNELKDTKAVIFVMNHSLTTSDNMAYAIAMVCNRRIREDNPLAAFAVTETGERRSFNPKMGIYRSAVALHNNVIPLPGPLIPNFIKLYAAVHKPDFEVNTELIDYMLKRLEGENDLSGEISESLVYQPDVDRVKKMMFVTKGFLEHDPIWI